MEITSPLGPAFRYTFFIKIDNEDFMPNGAITILGVFEP